MGIFDFLKQPVKAETTTVSIENSFASVHSNVAEQDRILAALKAADAAYKQDKDIDKLISVYEKELLHPKVKFNSQTKYLKLADLYYKTNQHDKAWGYLNSQTMTGNIPLSKIRLFQAKILKKEKKYLDALHNYTLGYVIKDNYSHSFSKNQFLKDTKVCFSNLGWPEKNQNDLINVIEMYVKRPSYSETAITKSFKSIAADTEGEKQ